MPEPSRFYSKNIEDLRDLVWLVDASMFDDPQIKRHKLILYQPSLSILSRSNYGSEKEIMMFGGKRLTIDLEKKFPTTLYSPLEWNLQEVRAVHVDHRKMACGYVLVDAKNGRKIVFSGDTRPCDLLVNQGKG
jgi:hypothetical protein